MPDMSNALALLTAPAILFFFLGAAAALVRSDLAIPEPVSKALSLYLMLCIGFKGGVEARLAGFDPHFLAAAAIGVALSALAPFAAYALLSRLTRLDRPTISALAATYGSVSVVTFAAGQQHLASVGLGASGHMAAVLALMETPAILSALILLNSARSDAKQPAGAVLREVLTGAATLLLIGSFAIGLISGEPGMKKLELFVGPLFQGALCFFLLDLGLVAARRLLSSDNHLSLRVAVFAIAFPLALAALALGLARLAGLPTGDAALMAILGGSASYIAVPAAMRIAAPKADAGVFVTASLAVTFPFNITLGIALYTAAAMALGKL